MPDTADKSPKPAKEEPWFILLYALAFMLFFTADWKLGMGWLFWRVGHAFAEEYGSNRAAQQDEVSK